MAVNCILLIEWSKQVAPTHVVTALDHQQHALVVLMDIYIYHHVSPHVQVVRMSEALFVLVCTYLLHHS
jgi:hypothetical protein